MAKAYLISAALVSDLKRMLRWWKTQSSRGEKLSSSSLHPEDTRLFPILGRADADVSADATGTFSVYSGTPTSESYTGVKINDVACKKAVAANEFVMLLNNGSGWYAVKFAGAGGGDFDFCATIPVDTAGHLMSITDTTKFVFFVGNKDTGCTGWAELTEGCCEDPPP